MKKALLAFLMIAVSAAFAQVQPTAPPQGNLNGVLFANGYGGWSVPQGNQGPFSWSDPTPCTVNYGGTTFPAFTVGTPITLYDQITPTHNETLTVTGVNLNPENCSITTSTPTYQHTQFSLGSASFGLQEAINANLKTSAPLTVFLTADWFRGGGTIAVVLGLITGNTKIGIEDVTATPSAWYSWGGTRYALVPFGGSAGALGTRQGDTLANNYNNTAAVDQDVYIANSPSAGTGALTSQQAATAAGTNNGSFVIQPNAGRTPFVNPGNYRAQDNRADVPATARNVTEDGAQCDTREVYGTLTSGSTTVTLTSGTFTTADVGRVIVAAITTASPPIQFESAIVSITDSTHAIITSFAPANMSTAHEIDLGHDDTTSIAHTMSVVGAGGTLVFPAGKCLTHTQTLAGQSPIGLGFLSQIVGMPGEDIFQAPDPSLTTGVNQGVAHIHDLSLFPDGRIDATQAWQQCNVSGCTAIPGLYRPVATLSAIVADPLAPGWMVGASNGVASITAASAVICVPNAETPPATGQTVIFPYLTSIYTATVASSAGSCSSGFTARTLNANLPAGSTNAQAEWFAGSSVQRLSTAITTCPTTITLANNINPVSGWESNVPAFGLIQIDGEQIRYFGKSNAGNSSPANTLYGIQCAQNGTTQAPHSINATVFPLNRFKPAYPWPVIPSINASDTTPAGTAGYYPGYIVGSSAFAFPVATGINQISTGGWSANSQISNLNIWIWPNEINGLNPQEVNNTAMFYFVTPHYATTFSNIYGLYTFFGIAHGGPSLENHAYFTSQPTADGTHYDGLQIYAANPFILAVGNQNTFSNFNVYSQEQTAGGSSLGADTCFYITHLADDQTGGSVSAVTLGHFKNIYCENEGGPHDDEMPIWEWDSYNSLIEDQHMGGGGEVYIGGAQQHWIGGNFNNSAPTPLILFGSQNTAEGSTIMGQEPKGNVYGVNSPINLSWGNDMEGTTAQANASPTGPYGATQVAGRTPIRAQTNEFANTGNMTAPYVSSEGGFISPEEFNANFSYESQAMNVGYTFDDTSPVTHGYAACNVGNNPGVFYCLTGKFNQNLIGVGPGQRITNGKYTMYASVKDMTAATNTWTFAVGTSCGGVIKTFTVPITNAWPTTAAGVFTGTVDFTGITTLGCGLGLIFQGATTADQIQIGYLDFAPVAEQFNAGTINVTNLNVAGSTTGGTANGCMQSPVLGISNGYLCPTKGFQGTTSANQGSTDTTLSLANVTGFPTASCFFVDTEYECYTGISSTTLTGVTRAQYGTTAATHTSPDAITSAQIVFGPTAQIPQMLLSGGGATPPILAINNAYPINHNGGGATSIFSLNSGGNELWVDTLGGIHETNPSAQSQLNPAVIGFLPFEPAISNSGYLLQSKVPNTAYSPQTLGGGHAGSLNVILTPTIGTPSLASSIPAGASTASWVCSGTDFDGNLIPGTPVTLSSIASTWSFPNGTTVACPSSSGVNTYQIYRTAGGGSQGLIASGVGPDFSTSDYGATAGGGTPPGSNASNPHISVAGTGNPCITMGSITICSGTGAPASTCGTAPNGSGSLWLRTDGGESTTTYQCWTTTWTAVTVP